MYVQLKGCLEITTVHFTNSHLYSILAYKLHKCKVPELF